MKRYALLLIPSIVGILATNTDYLPFKMGVPALCALILIIVLRRKLRQQRDVLFIVAAFIFSLIGDYFLSNKSGNEMYFVIGIGAYFVAHLGYLRFAWSNGRVHLPALGFLLLGFLPYYFFLLNPAIPDTVLSIAVLLYLLVSCLTFAAALGLRLPPLVKGVYAAGIFLILLSDTIISFNEFLQYREFNWLILPTYYLAHISITFALLRRDEVTTVAPPDPLTA